MAAHDETDAHERSLDPQSPQDWDALRALGHRMVDDMLDWLQGVRERPAWQALPEATRRHFDAPLPLEGAGAGAVYEEFREHVLPYPAGNVHPRFWGWVKGAGTPTGMLAELLAGGMNTNAWGNEQAASEVEAQVLAWFAALFGLPRESTGILTTGGSVANLVGLCVAREARGGFDAKGAGWGTGLPTPVLYCSTETHNSVDKAAALLGLGAAESVRKVPVRDDFAIDVDALRAAVAADLAAGRRPFCIVANVGTVNTGAIDDVHALADVAASCGAWLHVDGAFGALAVLAAYASEPASAPEPAPAAIRAMLARADSIAFDLHKWLSVPYDCGGVLVRHAGPHRAALTAAAGYLASETRGAAAGRHWFNGLGLELSRGFRALKAWFLLREHGVRRFGEQIAQNVRQARALAAMVEAAPDLELLAPVPLNVVCFRARPPALAGADDDDVLNELNREVLLRLQERGIAVPSATRLRGRFAIRVANVNHRSRMEDFEALVESVRAIAAEVAAERAGGPAAPAPVRA